MTWWTVVLCLSCSLITGWVSNSYTRSIVEDDLLRAGTFEQIAQVHLEQARNVEKALAANLQYQSTIGQAMRELRVTSLAMADPAIRREVETDARLTELERVLKDLSSAIRSVR